MPPGRPPTKHPHDLHLRAHVLRYPVVLPLMLLTVLHPSVLPCFNRACCTASLSSCYTASALQVVLPHPLLVYCFPPPMLYCIPLPSTSGNKARPEARSTMRTAFPPCCLTSDSLYGVLDALLYGFIPAPSFGAASPHCLSCLALLVLRRPSSVVLL
jgi:hypothetical protein